MQDCIRRPGGGEADSQAWLPADGLIECGNVGVVAKRPQCFIPWLVQHFVENLPDVSLRDAANTFAEASPPLKVFAAAFIDGYARLTAPATQRSFSVQVAARVLTVLNVLAGLQGRGRCRAPIGLLRF
jgi:hypothetical protein